MASTTITEALANLKTLHKRIEKKQQFVNDYLFRQEKLKDPLEKDGGSNAAIVRELQAILDLSLNIVNTRSAIAQANMTTNITVEGTTRTIADWLAWRRDIALIEQKHLAHLRSAISKIRSEAQRQGLEVVLAGSVAKDQNDIIVNINEQELATEIEYYEQVLGVLDGQLSLKNATVIIDV